jgi:hypothetical protein
VLWRTVITTRSRRSAVRCPGRAVASCGFISSNAWRTDSTGVAVFRAGLRRFDLVAVRALRLAGRTIVSVVMMSFVLSLRVRRRRHPDGFAAAGNGIAIGCFS